MKPSKTENFLNDRVACIKELKSPSQEQSLLVSLCEKENRSKEEDKLLKELIKAEKASVRLQEIKSGISQKLKTQKQKENKAKNQELCKSAKLMLEAGLLDSKTGKPLSSTEELLARLIRVQRIEISALEIEEAQKKLSASQKKSS